MRGFLRGKTRKIKKINWVKWEKCCTPKDFGGLGIRNLKATNKAMLAKWSWRYTQEKQGLW